MNSTYHLLSKPLLIFIIIIDILCALAIPAWIILILYNFNVFCLISVITLNIIIIVFSFYSYRKKFIILEDKIIYVGFKSIIMPKEEILSIKTNKGAILIETNSKIYKFVGYLYILDDFLELNEELVKKLNESLSIKVNKNNKNE